MTEYRRFLPPHPCGGEVLGGAPAVLLGAGEVVCVTPASVVVAAGVVDEGTPVDPALVDSVAVVEESAAAVVDSGADPSSDVVVCWASAELGLGVDSVPALGVAVVLPCSGAGVLELGVDSVPALGVGVVLPCSGAGVLGLALVVASLALGVVAAVVCGWLGLGVELHCSSTALVVVGLLLGPALGSGK